MKPLIIASKNQGKINEFKDLLQEYDIEVKSLLDYEEIPDVEETGTTFHENAALKAKIIGDLLDCPVIADDSGLMIDALDGRPGVYSARYAGEESDDEKNNLKVLKEMESVDEDKRSARYIAVLAFYRPGEEVIFREGYCEGEIIFGEHGKHGFGYDPIFIPKGYTKTMAQLKSYEKNIISHRAEALHQFKKWLNEHGL